MSMESNRRRGAAALSKARDELVRLDAVAMDEDDEILPDFEAEVGECRLDPLRRKRGIDPVDRQQRPDPLDRERGRPADDRRAPPRERRAVAPPGPDLTFW